MTKEKLDEVVKTIKNKELALIEEYNNVREKLNNIKSGEDATKLLQRLYDNLNNRMNLLEQYRQAYTDFSNGK